MTTKKRMTPAEAGRLGGLKTANRGPEHFRKAGGKGGRATKRKLGAEHYARIGRLGGLRVKAKTEA